MDGKVATRWVILWITVFCILYDIFAYLRWGPPATFSGVLTAAGQRWPGFRWAVGAFMVVLFLHWFFQDQLLRSRETVMSQFENGPLDGQSVAVPARVETYYFVYEERPDRAARYKKSDSGIFVYDRNVPYLRLIGGPFDGEGESNDPPADVEFVSKKMPDGHYASYKRKSLGVWEYSHTDTAVEATRVADSDYFLMCGGPFDGGNYPRAKLPLLCAEELAVFPLEGSMDAAVYVRRDNKLHFVRIQSVTAIRADQERG